MKKVLYAVVCVFVSVLLPLSVFAQAPVANFSASPTSGCTPIVVQFTDQSTGNPTAWSWNLGNGTTSTLQNPSTTYTVAGSYTITLTVTNSNGTNTKTSTNFIVTSPAPTVAFSASDTSSGCPPKTVSFNNQTIPNSPGTVNYYWDFGDGFTSNLANPTHIYTTVGNFSVTLVATNGFGCTSNLTKPGLIHTAAKPVTAFTATNNNSCTTPLTVAFNNGSSGAVSYFWSFGDGTTSTAASPTHIYNNIGSYSVTLVATNAGGCSDTLVKPAFVNIGALTAGFVSNSASTCTGNAVAFTNTTLPGAGASLWLFGDGTSSSASNPSHVYTAAGTYTVKLISNYNNCSDSVTHTITVLTGPTGAFTASPLNGCAVPFLTTFSNATVGATSFLWIFGDGSTSSAPSPTHSYSGYGSYTVKLVSTSANGCTDTLTKVNYINVAPLTSVIIPSEYGGCAPHTFNFAVSISGGNTISSITWNFGDGTSSAALAPSHTYSAAGTYPVTVNITTTNGCTSTATTSILVSQKPVAGFTVTPTTVCTNAPVQFTSTSTGGASYVYYFGDGGSSGLQDPVYTYSSPGVYTVTLVAANGYCRDTFVLQNAVTVLLPQANFTASYPCTNRKQWTFTNTSTGNTTNSWTFGDGTSSTAISPAHTYAANGIYTVTLTVTNATTGCTNVMSKTLTIADLSAAFAVQDSTLCPNATALFSVATPLPGATYSWTFGNGQTYTGTQSQVSTVYTSPGYYTVKMKVTDMLGCTDSLTKISYIRVGGATASFTGTPLSGCIPLTVTFTDASTANAGFAITSRAWNFGDGSTLNTTATAVTHTYTTAGAFTVSLTLTDAHGCVTSQTYPAYIQITKPVAAFTSPDTLTCINSTVHFTNTSTGAGGLTYAWSFGDGGTATSAAPTHNYGSLGVYSVRLIVTDANGCKDTLMRNAFVHVSTISASFTMSDSTANCPPLVVNFTNTSLGAASYLWNFGTGSTSTQVNPTAVFSTPGTFVVKLKAFNAGGCVDSFTKTVIINGGPSGTLSYTPLSGCLPLTVTFTSAAVNTTSKTFDFNNGVTQTTTANSVTYTYTTPGKFVPTVILSNGAGCNTAVIGSDTVKIEKVKAGFSAAPNPVCVGVAVQFTDTSSTIVSPVTTRSWVFGDGGTSTATNPTHTYATAGTYTVRLIASTGGGCPDTVTHTVLVNPLPVIVAANATICAGSSAQLTATGASTYLWSPATGLSCINCANPVANPPATTLYTITGTSAAGCVNTGNVTVTVNPLPVVSAGPNQSICGGGSVTLTATGASTYVWSPATGLSSTTGATVTANPAATTTYTVTGTSAANCASTATVTVNVGVNPTVTVTPSQSICAGASVVLTAAGANSYSWTPSTGLSCNNCSNPIATPGTTTTYTVTGTALNGCTGTATSTITVNPIPNVSAGSNVAICAGAATTLTASGATTYVWSPATGLSSTTGTSVTANPAATTTYTVTGTSANGCTNTSNVVVTVNPLPVVSAGPNVGICAGAATTLTASGAASYVWSPATGLSATTGTSVTANPTATTTYTVTGTNANGCSNTATVTVTVNPIPVVSAGPNQSICPGASTTLTATGANTYVWSPATGLSSTTGTTVTANPAATTTYTITGTSAAGCVGTGSITISVNNSPTITVSGNTALCTGGSTSLTAGGATSYTWSPATGLSATTGTTVTASPAATTTYTVTGTSGVGCTGTTTVTVTVNPNPVVSAGPNVAICTGASTALTASGAATYSWSPATGLSATTGATVTANPAATTTYTVTGTTAAGCLATSTVTVTVNPLPVVTVSNNTSICPGGSAALTAGGATSYVWSPATGLSSTTGATVTASPAATTTYTVTGTNANGCVNTATVTVTVNTQPVVTVAGNTTICAGGSTTLTASGANTFIWSPATGLSATNTATVTANPAATTTYTVTGTSGVGCTASTTVTVTVNPLPVVSAGANVSICAGSSTILTAIGASTYVWSPASGLSSTTGATVTANPAATTTYTVTGTSAAGCVNTAAVTVTIKPLPVVTVSSNAAICPGGAVSLTAGGAATYSWSPATGLSSSTGATVTASPAATTTYTVTGTGANGCTNTAAVTVTVSPVPVIAVSGNTNVCAGLSTTLTASGATTYVWSPATGLSSTTGATVTANPAATTTYTVTGTSGVGCTASTTVTVSVHPLPVVSAGAGQSVCAGVGAQLQATGAASYTWSPATGLSCTACPNPIATPAATTTYTVTGTDGFGCTGTATVTVTIKPLPLINAGPDVSICKLNSTQLTATGGVSYIWSPATALSATTGASVTANPVATATYTVTGTGANGCINTDAVTVNVYAQPPVNAGPDQTICNGQAAQLQATGAAGYVWSPATALSCVTCANPSATPSATITYGVVGTDIDGCIDSDKVVITVIPKLPISVSPGGAICEGESIQLTATGGDTYLWSPAATLSCAVCASTLATPVQTTNYQVIIKQGQCFADTLHALVTVHPKPTISAGPDQSIVAGASVQLITSTTFTDTYLWTPATGLSCDDCSAPVASPDRTTTYTVTASNQFGCTATDDVTISVRCDGNQVWLPNTFTPNGDGENDRFYPHGRGIQTVARFRIYDRWGELLFDGANIPVNDKNYGWDGTWKGQQLKPDVYVWILNATCTTGDPIEAKGDISLVR